MRSCVRRRSLSAAAVSGRYHTPGRAEGRKEGPARWQSSCCSRYPHSSYNGAAHGHNVGEKTKERQTREGETDMRGRERDRQERGRGQLRLFKVEADVCTEDAL